MIFKNYKIVFSGIRNKELEMIIESKGGKILNSVSKKTSCLIVKDKNVESGKIKKALKLNIPVYTNIEFIDNFKL